MWMLSYDGCCCILVRFTSSSADSDLSKQCDVKRDVRWLKNSTILLLARTHEVNYKCERTLWCLSDISDQMIKLFKLYSCLWSALQIWSHTTLWVYHSEEIFFTLHVVIWRSAHTKLLVGAALSSCWLNISFKSHGQRKSLFFSENLWTVLYLWTE